MSTRHAMMVIFMGLALACPSALASAGGRMPPHPTLDRAAHHRHHRPHRAAFPAHMLVYAQEWSLWPSRSSLPSGAVEVQLWNRGQDAHDLVIKRLSHGRMTGSAQDVAVTNSGAVSQASWHLAPGTYELFCSMPGHLARGMHTVLHVR
jgi:hypothetical protein